MPRSGIPSVNSQQVIFLKVQSCFKKALLVVRSGGRERMVGILAQVDDIFSWAPRGGKLIETRWGMRIQGHGYLNILYVGAIFVDRPPGKGSTGFCWINLTHPACV